MVASALALNETSSSISSPVKVKTLGGELNVSWTKNNNKYQDIILSGPVSLVFHGELIL